MCIRDSDGRLYYLKVIDQKNPQEGLKDLRYIDPMKLKFVKQEKRKNGKDDPYIRINSQDDSIATPEFDEYYIYSMKPNYPTGMIAQAGKGSTKIAKDSITMCTSGLVDRNKNRVLS